MNILYGEQITKTDVYKYTVNAGGELNIRVSNGSDRHVRITFVNGVLSGVDHNLGDFSLRSNWYVFKGIAEQIEYLEGEYKKAP